VIRVVPASGVARGVSTWAPTARAHLIRRTVALSDVERIIGSPAWHIRARPARNTATRLSDVFFAPPRSLPRLVA